MTQNSELQKSAWRTSLRVRRRERSLAKAQPAVIWRHIAVRPHAWTSRPEGTTDLREQQFVLKEAARQHDRIQVVTLEKSLGRSRDPPGEALIKPAAIAAGSTALRRASINQSSAGRQSSSPPSNPKGQQTGVVEAPASCSSQIAA